MPFYNVYVGYGIADTACADILANGIPSTIYNTPVRPINFYKVGSDQTVFKIQAADETIAHQWRDALIAAIGQVEEYIPEVVEGQDPPPSALDVWAKVGTWTKSIGSATTTVTGLTSAPKGLIMWGSGLSGATVGSFSEAGGTVFGFSDGTEDRCISYCTQDNVNPSNANRAYRKEIFWCLNPSESDHTLHHKEHGTVTFGSTSFDIAWDATTLATEGFYFVFGGNDIIDVQVKDFSSGIGEPSKGNVTYSDLGDRYDFGLLLTSQFTGLSSPPSSSVTALNAVSAHATNNNNKSWMCTIKADDNSLTANQHRIQSNKKLLTAINLTSTGLEQIAEWQEWILNGFILKWNNAPPTDDFRFSGLFVKGGHWDIGSFIQPTSIGTVSTLVEPYQAQVQGIMGLSTNVANMSSSSVAITQGRWTVGAEDAAGNRRCLSYGGLVVTSGSPTIEATGMFNDIFMKHITPTATASSSTINSQCSITDIATSGEFTVNYTTVAEATQRQTLWFCLSK
jgi:hypothetical protein